MSLTKELQARAHDVSNEFALISVRNIQKRNNSSFSSSSSSSSFRKQDVAIEDAYYAIEIISPRIISNNDIVLVQCSSNVPAEGDWIGAYSELFDDISESAPMKFGFCAEDPGYLLTGHGVLRFNLTNTRAGVIFSFFANGTTHPVQVASTNATSSVTFRNPNEPLRPRVMLTDSPNSLKLLWSSASSTTPQLRWGTRPGQYSNTVEATTESITKSSLCGEPASGVGWFDLGLLHAATFDNLLPLYSSASGSPPQVYYIFGDAATNDFSTEFTLHLPTLPGQSPAARPTSLVLMADLGRGSLDNTFSWHEYGRPSVNTTSSANYWTQRGGIDGVFHIGDLAYANGYLAAWDYYLNMISPLASSVVYMPALGNHELDYPGENTYYQGTDSGGECGVITDSVLPLPHPAHRDAPWWSYNIGLLHIVAVSSEHDFHPHSAQYIWLENDLSSVNRTTTPWVIFGCHRAMYINGGKTGTWDVDTMDMLISTIEPLLWQHRVNVGFYGHTHVVQRHSAVLNKTVVKASTPVHLHDTLSFSTHSSSSSGVVHTYFRPQATVHHVIGTAGAPFYVNDVSPPTFNELNYYKWGYVILQAVNASYLYWEWIESDTNLVIDRAAIVQDPAQTRWDLSTVDSTLISGDNTSGDVFAVTIANVIVTTLIVLSVLLVAVFHCYRYRRGLTVKHISFKSGAKHAKTAGYTGAGVAEEYDGDDEGADLGMGESRGILLTSVSSYRRVPPAETTQPRASVTPGRGSEYPSSDDDEDEVVIKL